MKQPVISVAATRSGRGYWLATRDGAIYTFGDAGYYGTAVGQLRSAFVANTPDPIGGMAGTGNGYWFVGQHEYASTHNGLPAGYHGNEVEGFGNAVAPVFHHVYEAAAGGCTVSSDGWRHASFSVTFTNGVKHAYTYSFPKEALDVDAGERSLQVGAYTLMWDLDARSCSRDPFGIEIEHYLKPGKVAKYAFSGSCSYESNGWGLYFSVQYTDGTTAGGHVAFDTDAVTSGGGTMYLDLGDDIAVSHTWTTFSCG